jgi:hypothetical protein
MKDNSFSVTSGSVSGNPQNFIAVLKNTANAIREENLNQNIQIYGLYISQSFHGNLPTKDDELMAIVNYWLIDEKEVASLKRDQKGWESAGLIEAKELKPLYVKRPPVKMKLGWWNNV